MYAKQARRIAKALYCRRVAFSFAKSVVRPYQAKERENEASLNLKFNSDRCHSRFYFIFSPQLQTLASVVYSHPNDSLSHRLAMLLMLPTHASICASTTFNQRATVVLPLLQPGKTPNPSRKLRRFSAGRLHHAGARSRFQIYKLGSKDK